MPYRFFIILLVIQVVLVDISEKMGESEITALLTMSIGATITIIILAKCGVNLK